MIATASRERVAHQNPGFSWGLTHRLPACEGIPQQNITDTLELTIGGHPIEGIKQPLLDSVQRSKWFSIDHGRIFLEVRNPNAFRADYRKRIRTIEGVDLDDCLVSATGWHGREHQLMQDRFKVPLQVGKGLYEASKITVPGKATGETRYTPRLNMALVTGYIDLLRRGVSEEGAYDEMRDWSQTVAGLVRDNGEVALNRQAVDQRVLHTFIQNPISKFLYQEFANAVFDPKNTDAFRFIATRGKIEGPLGQVYKTHTSGAMKGKDVDLVIYTNDLKAETLLFLSNLLPDQVKRKSFYLFDDNCDEIEPYLTTSSAMGLDVWVVQVCHPDAKRKDMRIATEPRRVMSIPTSEGQGDLVLNYYTLRPHVLSGQSLLQS